MNAHGWIIRKKSRSGAWPNDGIVWIVREAAEEAARTNGNPVGFDVVDYAQALAEAAEGFTQTLRDYGAIARQGTKRTP